MGLEIVKKYLYSAVYGFVALTLLGKCHTRKHVHSLVKTEWVGGLQKLLIQTL